MKCVNCKEEIHRYNVAPFTWVHTQSGKAPCNCFAIPNEAGNGDEHEMAMRETAKSKNTVAATKESESLPAVGGRFCEWSLNELEHRCLVTMLHEQEKPLPDNGLIAVLCNAVRLAREQSGNNILDESSGQEHYTIPEELWFSIPLGEDGMEHLHVFSFYSLGKSVAEQKQLLGDSNSVAQFFALAKIKVMFEIFLERSGDTTWKATRERARQLLNTLNEAVGDSPTMPLQPDSGFDTDYIEMVRKLILAFESTFVSESMNSNVFSVSQKGTHFTLDLMDRADANLSPDVRSRLSPEATQDIRQAGRCLALDCHTASGYHILRAVERVIIKYVEKVTKNVVLKKQPKDWGAYITALENHGGDSKVSGYLRHIKDHYRNPVIHPEDTLGPNDAFALFNSSLSAILQLDAAIEACH